MFTPTTQAAALQAAERGDRLDENQVAEVLRAYHLPEDGMKTWEDLAAQIRDRQTIYATSPDMLAHMHALAVWTRDRIAQETGGHGVLVGDIFVQRDGYDQTTVTFWLVRKATKTTVTVQQIDQVEVSDGPQTMTGLTIPNPAASIGEPIRRKVHRHPTSPTPFIEPDRDATSARLWDHTPARFSTYA